MDMIEPQNKADRKSNTDKKEGFNLPTLEITPERQEEILTFLAHKIIEHGLDVPAILFLTPLRPISPIVSQLTLLPFAPLLEAWDIAGFDYVSFFQNSDNVDRLLKKIEKINVQKRKPKVRSESWISKIRKKIKL